jgi:hypothetical protein
MHYTAEALTNGSSSYVHHAGMLEEMAMTVLHVDKVQTGVGGIDSWGSPPLPQHLVPLESTSYSFWLTPYAAATAATGRAEGRSGGGSEGGDGWFEELLNGRPQCVACT